MRIMNANKFLNRLYKNKGTGNCRNEEYIKTIKNWCSWFAIIIVFTFIHCFRIGSIPYGINVDEMGMGYDAWCLSMFGTDRYLNSFPVYLINFSGGQSALYAYLCAPLVKAFGISATVLRIPAIIFSFVTLFFAVKIANFLWNDTRMNLLVGFLYMIFPVFLMLSRIGLDCNLMLGMSAAFLYFILNAVERQRNQDYLLAGVSGGLLLYSYVISHMVLPVFLLLLVIILIFMKKISIKQVFFMAIPLFLLAAPLMLMHFINMFGLEEMRLGIFTIPRLYRYRSDDLSLQVVGKNLLGFFQTTLMYDDVPFNSIPFFGNMYFLSIPLILTGLGHGIWLFVQALKKRCWEPQIVMILWTASVYITGIFIGTGDGPNVYQVNSIYLAYLFFCADGMLVLYLFVKKICRKLAQAGLPICIGIYCCLFAVFTKYYFFDYTDDTYLIDLFNFKFEDVLVYMKNELPERVAERTTYIGDGNQTYIYYLGSTMISPYDYNILEDDKPYTLWLWTESYQNYRFNFPEEIDPSGNYIVPETSTEWITLYEQYGFEKEHIGTHYLFWNSILDEEVSSAQAVVSWDHGVIDGKIVMDNSENTVLSGWALNMDYDIVWNDVIACVDGEFYPAEKIERKDLADVLQNDVFLMSGFRLIIPNDVLKKGNVKIIFIDYDHKVCYVERYE